MALHVRMALFLFLTVFVLYTISSAIFPGMPPAIGRRGGRRSWQDTVADKRLSLASRIPVAWTLDSSLVKEAKRKRRLVGDFFDSLLDAETKVITSMDNVDIVSAIAEQSLSAVQVTTAYCKRAVYAHQIVRMHVHPCTSKRA